MAVLSRLLLAAGLACGALAEQGEQQVALNRPTYDVEEKPLVTGQLLQDAVNIDDMMERVWELYKIAKLSEPEYGHATRVIGSQGHNGTLKYVIDTLQSLNHYDVSVQNFPVSTSIVHESSLIIDHMVMKEVVPMRFSPSTRDRKPVTGHLILVANKGCTMKDFPKEVEGNIALIKRGNCTFGDKSLYAGQAGALAAVIYNTDDGELNRSLGDPKPKQVATFGIRGSYGERLVQRLKHGKGITVTAHVDADIKTITATNVLAKTRDGDQNNMVSLGAHSDSVEEGPGCNDDGSGLISLLQIAVALTRFSVKYSVFFGFWAAEEEGLLGSTYFTDHLSEAENKKFICFIDIDMMASPNFAYQIYNSVDSENPAGSEALRDLFVEWFVHHNLNYTFVDFDGRSDYVGFIQHGIPACGISTGAEGLKTKEEAIKFGGIAGSAYDECYHQECDDVTNVNVEAFETTTKALAYLIGTLAHSSKGLPPRETTVESTEFKTMGQMKYRGHRLLL